MNDNLAHKYSPPNLEDSSSEPETLMRSGGGPIRVRRLRWVFVLAAVGLCLLLTAKGIDYLADMPRERAQRKYSYTERVWYGLSLWSEMISLRFAASADPYPKTELPSIELQIPASELSKLNADLPASGKVPKEAMVAFEEGSFPVQARYTGISINHWGMPWKSWNFKFKDEGSFQGLKNFNIMSPRSDTQFENWLGNEMSRRMGSILTPHSEFVHFRLNGSFNGARLLLEPATPQFLARLGLPPGKLFHGDITTAQIYDGVPRERLFSEPGAWDVQSPFPDSQGPDEMAALIRIVQRVHNPYDFFYELPSVANMRALTSYMALLEIVSSVHIDETHNWKMYLDPRTKLLEPIIWNSVAYYWKNTKSIDLAPNDLFRVVLSNPEFREDKDRAIWNAIHGPLSEQALTELVNSERDRVAPDMYASALKWGAGDKGINLLSNDEWDAAIKDLVRIIAERHNFLRNELMQSEASYRLFPSSPQKEMVAVQVGSRSGVKVQSMQLKLLGSRPGQEIRLSRRGIEDLNRPLAPAKFEASRRQVRGVVGSGGVVSFDLGDTLTSKRRAKRKSPVLIVPATYIYELDLPKGVRVEKLLEFKASNSVTGGSSRIVEDSAMEIPVEHTPNIVWWSPREFLVQ